MIFYLFHVLFTYLDDLLDIQACSYFFVGCCFQDFFKTAHKTLVYLTSTFNPSSLLFSMWCCYINNMKRYCQI